jgi:Tol biopolymer transport system component
VTPEASWSAAGVWSSDDTILFSAPYQEVYRLHRVEAAGGAAERVLVESDSTAWVHGWPDALPDGEHVIYAVRPQGAQTRDGRVELLSLQTGESRTLIENGYNARYTPTEHIVFMRSGDLWAVPFDPDRLERAGSEVPVVLGVRNNGATGSAAYAFSNEGLLVYVPGGDTSRDTLRSLVWLGRDGEEQVLDVEPQVFRDPRLSPDGDRLAIAITDSRGNSDIWIYDLEDWSRTRLTISGQDNTPRWSPDGSRVVFRSVRDGGGVFWKAADNTGQVERLVESRRNIAPQTISPDGRLVYRVIGEGTQTDLYIVPLDGGGNPEPLLASDWDENWAEISPNGRFIAYEGTVEGSVGSTNIYVRPFPNVENGGPWQISTDRGYSPAWAPNGRELLYRSRAGAGITQIMSVDVETESIFSHSSPSPLFEEGVSGLVGPVVLSGDGERFLVVKDLDLDGSIDSAASLTAIENWFAELNRLAPRSDGG